MKEYAVQKQLIQVDTNAGDPNWVLFMTPNPSGQPRLVAPLLTNSLQVLLRCICIAILEKSVRTLMPASWTSSVLYRTPKLLSSSGDLATISHYPISVATINAV